MYGDKSYQENEIHKDGLEYAEKADCNVNLGESVSCEQGGNVGCIAPTTATDGLEQEAHVSWMAQLAVKEAQRKISIYRQRVDENACYEGEYDHNHVQHEDGGAARILVGEIEQCDEKRKEERRECVSDHDGIQGGVDERRRLSNGAGRKHGGRDEDICRE